MLADNRPQWNAAVVASVGEPAAKEGLDPLMQQLTDGLHRTKLHHSTYLQNLTDRNEYTVNAVKLIPYIVTIVPSTAVQVTDEGVTEWHLMT